MDFNNKLSSGILNTKHFFTKIITFNGFFKIFLKDLSLTAFFTHENYFNLIYFIINSVLNQNCQDIVKTHIFCFIHNFRNFQPKMSVKYSKSKI